MQTPRCLHHIPLGIAHLSQLWSPPPPEISFIIFRGFLLESFFLKKKIIFIFFQPIRHDYDLLSRLGTIMPTLIHHAEYSPQPWDCYRAFYTVRNFQWFQRLTYSLLTGEWTLAEERGFTIALERKKKKKTEKQNKTKTNKNPTSFIPVNYFPLIFQQLEWESCTSQDPRKHKTKAWKWMAPEKYTSLKACV